MIVVFEGLDGSGKTTLLNAFNAETQYRHIAVDRMFLSHMVYARYYHRESWMNLDQRAAEVKEFKQFVVSMRPLVVYMTAEPHVLEERIHSRGEIADTGPNPRLTAKMYDEAIYELGFRERILHLDTTLSPLVSELVKRVVGKIESLELSYR